MNLIDIQLQVYFIIIYICELYIHKCGCKRFVLNIFQIIHFNNHMYNNNDIETFII